MGVAIRMLLDANREEWVRWIISVGLRVGHG
jgi:hypothetical protein